MSQLLEQKQKQAEDEQRKGALAANAEQIFRDEADYVAGNPEGTSPWSSSSTTIAAGARRAFPRC